MISASYSDISVRMLSIWPRQDKKRPVWVVFYFNNYFTLAYIFVVYNHIVIKTKDFNMAMIFCTECGKKMSSQAITCPHCGCPNKTLGKSINGLYKGKKSIVVYLLLCWFLGIIGAHRYYAGKYGTAILMTVLTITFVGMFITCIWALIDLIVGFCCLGTPEKIFAE